MFNCVEFKRIDLVNFGKNYVTLDLDWEIEQIGLTCSYEKVLRILEKISRCEYMIDFDLEPSARKGFHIRIYCNKKCDNCRFVFDDFRRYSEDRKRFSPFRNMMFDKKSELIVK